MPRFQNIWYGFNACIIVAGFATIFAVGIRDDNVWGAFIGAAGFVVCAVGFGSIFIGAAIAERDERRNYESRVTRSNR